MTTHVYRCMLVPDTDVTLARKVWALLDPEYSREFRIPLAAADAPEVITHWMSAGPVTTTAAYLLPLKTWDAEGQEQYYPGHPDKVAAQCRAAEPPLEVTDEQIEALWLAADVSEQPVATAMERLGLVYWEAPPEPEAEPQPKQLDDE